MRSVTFRSKDTEYRQGSRVALKASLRLKGVRSGTLECIDCVCGGCDSVLRPIENQWPSKEYNVLSSSELDQRVW
jgi:hypothetical protein